MALATNPFKTATKELAKLRMSIDGPAGAGKSYTAMRLAQLFAQALGKPVAAIDTETGSLSKYVGKSPDGFPWQFDVVQLKVFAPKHYTSLINTAAGAGYGCLVIDSLSHAWEGKGGSLEQKEQVAAAQRSRNDWTAWRAVTPEHQAMVEAILQAPMHVFTTMRSRMEYAQEKGDDGKNRIVKVGLAPVQRPGMEYEFDVVADMDIEHRLTVSKSRGFDALDGWSGVKPGPELAAILMAELGIK